MIGVSSRGSMRQNKTRSGGLRTGIFRAAVAGFFVFCLLSSGALAAPSQVKDALHIYFVDVEGGQATLFVTPAKQSLLIDTGWSGNGARDADRIVEAAKRAGISKIDYVLIT